MIVSAIAAMSRTGVIGDGIKMPWHLPRDLRRFRDATMDKPLIMGRRTLESLRGPLPGRLNIALSHSAAYRAEGFRIARSIEEALEIAKARCGEDGEIMIIGGGVVFRETVPLWDRLLLTVVDGEFQGDAYFPLERAKKEQWRLADRDYCAADSKNAHSHWFLDLERAADRQHQSQAFDLSAWLSGQSGPIAGVPLTHRGRTSEN